jgi:fucose 4-O-acetylase-like acetyltransferase
MKERLLYIDRLRGMTIVGVVIGHFMQTNTVEGVNGTVWNMISSFKMTLFMFLCGYIAQRTTRTTIFNNYTGYILKKGRTLLLPCFFWPLVVSPFFFASALDYNFKNIFLNIINEGGNGWFLYILFFLSLIFSAFFYVSTKVNKLNKILVDCAIGGVQLGILIVLSLFHLFPLINVLILYYAFYFLGVIIAKYEVFQKIMLHHLTFTVALVVFMVTIGWFKFGDSTALNRLIKMIISLSSLVIFYFVARQAVFNKTIDSYLMYWGKNSIVIYLTHFSFVYTFLMPAIYLPALNPVLLLLVSTVVSVVIVICCMGVYSVVRLSPVLNLLLYGHKLDQSVRNKELAECAYQEPSKKVVEYH